MVGILHLDEETIGHVAVTAEMRRHKAFVGQNGRRVGQLVMHRPYADRVVAQDVGLINAIRQCFHPVGLKFHGAAIALLPLRLALEIGRGDPKVVTLPIDRVNTPHRLLLHHAPSVVMHRACLVADAGCQSEQQSAQPSQFCLCIAHFLYF